MSAGPSCVTFLPSPGTRDPSPCSYAYMPRIRVTVATRLIATM